jgi:hypothetical protein
VYGKIRWLAGLLTLIGLPKLAFSATHPDLALAPPPNLSQAAWNELQRGQTAVKTVSLHAQITAQHGAITDVTVKESAQLPQTYQSASHIPQSAFPLLVPQCFDRIERRRLVRGIETEHNTDY